VSTGTAVPLEPGDELDLLLRPLTAADHPAVLALNAESVAVLSPLDEARLTEIAARCTAAFVVEDAAGAVVAFCLALPEGTDYDGDHHRWFAERYDRFLYLDRIVVAAGARRRGVGSLLYDACEAIAAAHGRMLCEVDVEPPNPTSLAFHAARGYVEVGRRTGPTGKAVALLAKELQDG
jgi:predicted GNAT superfamily acetyltransferase